MFFSKIVTTFAASKIVKIFNLNMANHKSALKRIRQTEKRRLENRYYARTTRNAVKRLRSITQKETALELYPKVASMLDKLAKKDVIHKNKASNLKAKLSSYINTLA